MFVVLSVCVGNICRSPIIERLLHQRLAGDKQFVVESAGVGAVVGHPLDALAVVELQRLGGTSEGFAARQLTTANVEQADLVLTATVDVRARALREEPRALKRTFTIAEFAAICARADDQSIVTPHDLVSYAAAHRALAAGTDLDVRDPIGRGAAEHRAVADQIDGYVTTIAARLGPLLEAHRGP